MASQQPNTYIELEYLNVIYPVQQMEASHRKRVRKHVMNRYWKTRKIHARSPTLSEDRQLLLLQTPPECVCHGLESNENIEPRKFCRWCGGGVSLRSNEKGALPRLEIQRNPGKSTATMTVTYNGTDELSTLLERRNPRHRLGDGDRDPFSSLPVSTEQDSDMLQMLLRHCK
jgi:hypothetical protein